LDFASLDVLGQMDLRGENQLAVLGAAQAVFPTVVFDDQLAAFTEQLVAQNPFALKGDRRPRLLIQRGFSLRTRLHNQMITILITAVKMRPFRATHVQSVTADE